MNTGEKLKQTMPPLDEVVQKLKELSDNLAHTEATLQNVVNKLGMPNSDSQKTCCPTEPADMPGYFQYEPSTTLYQLNSFCETLESRYRYINSLTNQLQYFIG